MNCPTCNREMTRLSDDNGLTFYYSCPSLPCHVVGTWELEDKTEAGAGA